MRRRPVVASAGAALVSVAAGCAWFDADPSDDLWVENGGDETTTVSIEIQRANGNVVLEEDFGLNPDERREFDEIFTDGPYEIRIESAWSGPREKDWTVSGSKILQLFVSEDGVSTLVLAR